MLLRRQFVLLIPVLRAYRVHDPYSLAHLTFINWCLFKFKHDTAWRNLPAAAGNINSIISKHRCWRRNGLWAHLHKTLTRLYPNDTELLATFAKIYKR